MSEQTISRNPSAQTHPSGERVVVFHSQTKDSIVLNPTGSWLWQQLEAPKTEGELVEALKSEFPDVDAEMLSSDLKAYIQELCENSILVVGS